MKGTWLLFKEEEVAKQTFLECSLPRHVAMGGSSAVDGELRKKSNTDGYLLNIFYSIRMPTYGHSRLCGEYLFPWQIQIVDYDQCVGNESVSYIINDHDFYLCWG